MYRAAKKLSHRAGKRDRKKEKEKLQRLIWGQTCRIYPYFRLLFCFTLEPMVAHEPQKHPHADFDKVVIEVKIRMMAAVAITCAKEKKC